MNCMIQGAQIYENGAFLKKDILIEDGRISTIAVTLPIFPGVSVYKFDNCFVFPGFSDVHVHLREPGFSFKETIATGTAAAARGGFTSVCTMPNLDPVPDCAETLAQELHLIRQDACVHVFPYGSITAGERGNALSEMDELAPLVCAFSDDGVGVQDEALMEGAMRRAKSLGKLIVSHCEMNALLRGGCVHDGVYAHAHDLPGISSESEWRMVERDIRLVRKTGCSYHVCHVSTKESVDLIRRAKAEGLDVSCETAPHYLTLCDEDLQDDGRFKMNPPIRSRADREALIEGVKDGTVDIISTDHAPHTAEEKSGGLRGAKNGVVGLETAFPVLYTELVKPGVITLERLVELLHDAPMRRFGIGTPLAPGQPADLTVFDLCGKYTVDPTEFKTMGRATPFEGWRVNGRCLLTMVGGEPIWKEERKH
ncbi:MAG: dihydroorotase [Oscillospiraceae bacterium]|jgi:dihydroorotase